MSTSPVALFPMFVKLEGRRCVVVGGGPIAESKVESLLTSGAEVIVVSPTLTVPMAELRAQGFGGVVGTRIRSGGLEWGVFGDCGNWRRSDQRTRISRGRAERCIVQCGRSAAEVSLLFSGCSTPGGAANCDFNVGPESRRWRSVCESNSRLNLALNMQTGCNGLELCAKH